MSEDQSMTPGIIAKDKAPLEAHKIDPNQTPQGTDPSLNRPLMKQTPQGIDSSWNRPLKEQTLQGTDPS
jgi:hypothetical protein